MFFRLYFLLSALQDELESLVQRLQDKSSRIIELTNQNKVLQRQISQADTTASAQRQENVVLQEDNHHLLNRVRELEEHGRALNNQSVEHTIRAKELESEVRIKERDLRLQQAERERTRDNAQVLEKKVIALRETTQQGIATRDDIIRQKQAEIQRLNQRLAEMESDFHRAVAAKDDALQRSAAQLADSNEQRLHKNDKFEQVRYVIATLLMYISPNACRQPCLLHQDTPPASIGALHHLLTYLFRFHSSPLYSLDNVKLRALVQELQDKRKSEQQEHKLDLDSHRREIDTYIRSVRSLQNEVRESEERTQEATARLAQTQDAQRDLISNQRDQLNQSVEMEERWAKKLLKRELQFEKEKQSLEALVDCRICPRHRKLVHKLKAKIRKLNEQIRLLTLSLPKRHNCAVHNAHWVPPGPASPRKRN